MPHPPRRTVKSTSREVEQRLLGYALAATAAGVALAAATPASAQIVYTPTDVTITRGMLSIDMNADGINDFLLVDDFYTAPQSRFPLLGGRRLLLGGSPSGSVIPFNKQAAVLNSGSLIGSSRSFQNVHDPRIGMAAAKWRYQGSTGTCCIYVSGNWENVKNQYLGLKFQISGQTHYGWAKLSVKAFEDQFLHTRVNARLTGYAYEATPGKTIAAGDTGGSAARQPSPSSGTLGNLARGAIARTGTKAH